ncbi:hypothetical protein LTR17_026730 [Elasticomyces elasticus]|nr:hypothetical protein LTR17_026730 [Elasticomyces elasticus]
MATIGRPTRLMCLDRANALTRPSFLSEPLRSRQRRSPQYRPFNGSSTRRQGTAANFGDTKGNLPLSGITVVLGCSSDQSRKTGQGDFNRHHDKRIKGMCSHFVWTNRSKESLASDLKQPRAAVKEIIGKADVLVQNLAPGATERMGLGYGTLKEKHPSLIVCDISGYGSTGLYRNKKAYDLLIQSESGFLYISGSPGQPAKAGNSIADIAAGTTAFNNILAAIIQRGKTGKGCRLDVSMLESLAEWMTFPMYYAYDGASPPAQAGAEHASIYPQGPFDTGGAGTVMLCMQNEREWGIFCRNVLKKPELTEDERFANTSTRSKNRKELRAIIEEVSATHEADDVLHQLQTA